VVGKVSQSKHTIRDRNGLKRLSFAIPARASLGRDDEGVSTKKCSEFYMRHLSRKDGLFLRIPAPEGASDRLKTAANKSSSPAHFRADACEAEQSSLREPSGGWTV
jgi:hypothetical protein